MGQEEKTEREPEVLSQKEACDWRQEQALFWKQTGRQSRRDTGNSSVGRKEGEEVNTSSHSNDNAEHS